MIFTLVINSIAWLVNWVAGWLTNNLPAATVASGLAAAQVSASHYMNAMDFWFPVSTLTGFLVFVFIPIELAIWKYKGLRWGWQKIPGVN